MVANILVNWLISIGKKREKANYNIKKSYFPLKITAYSIAASRMAKKLANMIKKYCRGTLERSTNSANSATKSTENTTAPIQSVNIVARKSLMSQRAIQQIN